MSTLEIVRQTLTGFCLEFIRHPYLSYTEHGLHASFYCMLLNALPEDTYYITVLGQKMSILQKEYPTAGNLSKSRRQHWDVVVLNAKEGPIRRAQSYDYMRILAAIEFGMNEAKAHLIDDIQRLSHPDANVEQGFIVHLYRLSQAGALFSGRDMSPNSPQILKPEDIVPLSLGTSVEIFYGRADMTHKYPNEVWHIKNATMHAVI